MGSEKSISNWIRRTYQESSWRNRSSPETICRNDEEKLWPKESRLTRVQTWRQSVVRRHQHNHRLTNQETWRQTSQSIYCRQEGRRILLLPQTSHDLEKGPCNLQRKIPLPLYTCTIPIASVATVNDRHFWKFEIAWEIKFEKLPKYLGEWRTPKTGGSRFEPKESDQ